VTIFASCFFLERPWEFMPSALAATRSRKRVKYHTSLTGSCQCPPLAPKR
jgi:hypothetical protein